MIPPPYAYADEKLYGGLLTLAASEGSLRGRLVNAWVSWFHRINMEPSFPPGLQERWDTLYAEATARPASGSGSTFEASIEAMDDSAAIRHAEEIVSLFWQFEQFLIRGGSS